LQNKKGKIANMQKVVDIKRFSIYLWAALVFTLLGLLSNFTQFHESYFKRDLDDVWRLVYVMILNYFLYESVLPRLSWKRTGKSIFLILIFVFLYSYGLYLWRQVGIGMGIYNPFPSTSMSTSRAVAAQMGYSVGAILFFGIVRHIFNHIKLKRSAQQLRIEKQQAELNYLKSQTNPHFLFNTLNNIYSLARDKSDLAPESILRLSKILRYMLYETSGPYVAIEQELKIISDYIALEKLRYDDSLRIHFNYDIEDMKQSLPPLIMVPLVENAFKHGASETRGLPFVDIHLSVNKRQLALIVKNSTGGFTGETGVKENIGLSNLRRQLELLYTDYELSVQPGDPVFTAVLKINLASHV
jgi:two-component system LytT family sensor kinase